MRSVSERSAAGPSRIARREPSRSAAQALRIPRPAVVRLVPRGRARREGQGPCGRGGTSEASARRVQASGSNSASRSQCGSSACHEASCVTRSSWPESGSSSAGGGSPRPTPSRQTSARLVPLRPEPRRKDVLTSATRDVRTLCLTRGRRAQRTGRRTDSGHGRDRQKGEPDRGGRSRTPVEFGLVHSMMAAKPRLSGSSLR